MTAHLVKPPQTIALIGDELLVDGEMVAVIVPDARASLRERLAQLLVAAEWSFDHRMPGDAGGDDE